MKNFLIVSAVALVAAVELWNLGLAAQVWPSHPLIATAMLASAIAIAFQLYLSSDTKGSKRGDFPR
jgi:hypothetical protein